MLIYAPMNGEIPDFGVDNGVLGGHLNPSVASVKEGARENNAYGGIPQGDDPSVLEKLGEAKLEEDPRNHLASYLQGVWNTAVTDRQSNRTDEELLACLRQFNGKYDANDLAELSARGFPPVYFPLSEHKVHTAVAWIDEFFTNGENLINVKPTPVPELERSVVEETQRQTMADTIMAAQQTGVVPDAGTMRAYAIKKRGIVERQLQDEAEQRALRMERVLRDDLVQGGWSEKIHDLIGFASIYGTGGFRSPVITVKREKAWVKGKLVKRDRIVRSFEAISPFDLFPSPGMTDPQNGDLCVRVRYQPNALSKMRKQPLWIKDSIDEVLGTYGKFGLRLDVSSDTERRTLTGQTSLRDSDGCLEGFEFWGSVSGRMLNEIGITKTPEKERIEDSDSEWYEVNAVVIGSRVVYCRVMDDTEDRPIDVVKFYDTPGSFFGRGPLQLIASLQRICNAAGRAVVVNMGFSAGPQAIIDMMSIDPRDDLKLRPMKGWVARRSGVGQTGSKPIEFFQPESNAKQLTDVFEFFQRLADEVTGIPAYANGTDAATGAARTATGLNMLFGAANRGIKKVIGNFDELVKRSVRRLFNWHMEFNRDDSIKGDVNIEVTGLKFFVTKTAQANDRLALLSRITQDQRMAALQSPRELAKMMREIAVAMDLPPESLAPDGEELSRREEEQREQQAVAQQEAERQQQVAQDYKLEQIGAQGEAAAMSQRPQQPSRPKEAAQ